MAKPSSHTSRTSRDLLEPGSLQPDTYYKNDDGRIIKIKDTENEIVIFDLNGREKRYSNSDFFGYLEQYDFVEVDPQDREDLIKDMVKGDGSANEIVNFLR